MKRLPVAQPRIVGVETEYGIKQDARYFQVNVTDNVPPDIQVTAEGYTSAGGKIYFDSPNIEYCTPESITVNGLLSAHIAGERLTSQVVAGMTNGLYKPIKRSVDIRLGSRGEHENYLIGCEKSIGAVAGPLLSHLAARPVITGPGCVDFDDGRLNFFVDQRGLVTGQSIYKAKKFFKELNVCYGTEGSTQRLEIMSGSHNMYTFPLAARVFNTSSVLRLIEHSKYPDGFTFQDPDAVIYGVSTDPALQTRYPLDNGQKLTALEFEHELMTRVLNLDLPTDEQDMARATAVLTDEMMQSDFSNIRGRVEWIDKFQMLEAASERRGRAFPSIDDVVIDIKWHLLDDANPVFGLRARGHVALLPSEDDIKGAMHIAPDATRARLRGAAIERAYATPGGYLMAEWNEWTDGIKLGTRYVGNPYKHS